MEDKLKFHMRLRLYRRERNFGPGVAMLMEGVRETASLSAACKELGMSYSKAWKIIKKAEEDLGCLLMEGTRGGESGGGTVLTEEGVQLLARYQRFEAEAGEVVERLFCQIFEEEEEA